MSLSFPGAGLAIGLGIGAIAEAAKKTFKPQQQGIKRKFLHFIDGCS